MILKQANVSESAALVEPTKESQFFLGTSVEWTSHTINVVNEAPAGGKICGHTGLPG